MDYIKIYGERHTSTNYLSRLIDSNLQVEQLSGVAPRWINRLEHTLHSGHRLRDRYFARSFASNLGWKHTLVPAERVATAPLVRGGRVGIVTLTKNPYAWLLSLHRNPYHQNVDPDVDLATFVQAPLPPLGRENLNRAVTAPELWNLKNGAYLRLADAHCHRLTSEALLDDDEGAIQAIANKFHIEPIGAFVPYGASTKKRPGQDGEFYRDYYLNERWREHLSEEAIGLINAALDPDVVKAFGYELIA